MDLKDLMEKADSLTEREFEIKLNELVRENYKYKNLSSDNREIVLDLVKKYKDKVRRGVGISEYTLRLDTHNLYEKRLKLNLTENDLEDIKEILEEFRK
jgi:hypothetical protein